MSTQPNQTEENVPNPRRSRRERFVTEYLIDLNATRAALRAGYSPKTAYAQGCRLLKDVQVKSAIDAGIAGRAEQTGITATRVVRELEMLTFSDVRHYVADEQGNVHLAEGAPDDAMRAIQSIKRRFITTGTGEAKRTTCEVEIKLWDKPGPLKLAGRHVDVHGFLERLEVTGKNGGPVEAMVAVYKLPENGRGRK